MVLYTLPAYKSGDVDAFLRALARVRKFVKTGGDLDLVGAARSMLKDWNANQLPYYTMPPPSSEKEAMVEEDQKLQEIYKQFDSEAIASVQSRNMLWSTSGSVKFSTGKVDERPIILEPPIEHDDDSDEEVLEQEEDDDDDETMDSVSSEGSDVDEDVDLTDDDEDVEMEEAPGSMRSNKRPRTGQAPIPDQKAKSKKKKVTFETKLPKKRDLPRKPPAPKAKAPIAPKAVPQSNAGKTSTGEEAYDFTKFF